jgi:hypothetical protein
MVIKNFQTPLSSEFAPSFVHVPAPTVPGGDHSAAGALRLGPLSSEPLPRRSTRMPPVGQTVAKGPVVPSTHKPVKQRWFYEPKLPPTITKMVIAVPSPTPLAVMMGTSPASGSDDLTSSGPGPSRAGLVPVVPGFLIGAAPRTGITEIGGADLPPLHGHEARDGQFTIVVSYPGREHCPHDHAVFHGMPVDALRRTLSSLLQMTGLVLLTVSPTWLALDHGGAITDRVFPGSTIPCPFLEQASEVHVLVTAMLSVALLGTPNLVSDVASGLCSSRPQHQRGCDCSTQDVH